MLLQPLPESIYLTHKPCTRCMMLGKYSGSTSIHILAGSGAGPELESAGSSQQVSLIPFPHPYPLNKQTDIISNFVPVCTTTLCPGESHCFPELLQFWVSSIPPSLALCQALGIRSWTRQYLNCRVLSPSEVTCLLWSGYPHSARFHLWFARCGVISDYVAPTRTPQLSIRGPDSFLWAKV